MKRLYSKPVRVFGSVAMVLLCTVFFLLPFALRGARLGLTDMQNNISDWLPSHYTETKDLNEFGDYFYGGDQFVVVSGDWCKEGDPKYINLKRKIYEESLDYEKFLEESQRRDELEAHRKGDELGLLYTGNYYEDWGEERERWLLGRRGQWYFINRRGELFSWRGQNNVVEGVKRSLERMVNGKNKAVGRYIGTFGAPPDDARGIENEFYADPTKLCCRPFKSVMSGPDVFEKMAGPEGTLRKVGQGEEAKSTFEAKIEAHQRLTGALFGPTPSKGYNWTFDSLLSQVDENRQSQLRDNQVYRQLFDEFIAEEIAENYNNDINQLCEASSEDQLELWYELWYKLNLDPPPRQTCLIVTLNEPVIGELARAVGRPVLGKPRGRLLELATGRCGIKLENLRMGGPPSDNVAIDEEGSITLFRLVSLSLIIGFTLAYLSFGSVRVSLMLFFVGGTAAISSLAYVWFAGQTMDAILMSMPSLVYVLALSAAVHIVNYYRDACYENGPDMAVETAVAHSWFPCTLAAFTTGLGLISLTLSNLTPIYKFGLFSAIAVMATVILLFTYLPSALLIWSPGYKKRDPKELETESSLSAAVHRTWLRIGDWVIGHHWLVTSVSVAALIFFAVGISRVETSVQLLKLFDRDAKILNDYRWMEDNLGQLVPAEIALQFDLDAQKEPYNAIAYQEQLEKYKSENAESLEGLEGSELQDALKDFGVTYDDETKLDFRLKYSMLERVELSRRVRQQLERFFGPNGMGIVGSGMSMDVFLPLFRATDQKESKPRDMFANALFGSRDQMLEQEYLAVLGKSGWDNETIAKDQQDTDRNGREMWRVSIRLAALSNVDYGQFINDLKSVVEPILTAYRYRTKILKTVQQELGMESVNNGKVLIFGPDPSNYDVDIRRELNDGAKIGSLIDQTYIFSETLRDLLENRGYLKRGPKIYRWIDPAIGKVPESEKFREFISRFDCVVFIADDPLFDRDMIFSTAKNLVDCRDHRFEVDPETNLPVEGMLTAKEIRESDQPDENIDVVAMYTGIIPIVYKAQRSLLQSLIESIGLAFVMISVVMMLLLRDWNSPTRPGNLLNIRGGMVSMLPNVFPVVIVFGFMGHMNQWYGGTVDSFLVDIGSMMTASVAMGVAVDDTIHFLNWYRYALNKGFERKAAIREAYSRVATAMTQTTLIGGFGLSAFA
ncbi:MAG: MMPL family transporter, partial [Planctomycetota bacterium]